jgi:hypothetical protein
VISRLISALLLVAVAGPNQPVAAATRASTAKQSNAPTQLKAPADAQIERAIKNKLMKSKMNAEHFTVSVVKGVATLEGNTNVMQHKGAMTRMARSSGATSVHNNIRISPAAKNKAVASLAKGRSSQPAAQPRFQPAPPMTSRLTAPGATGNLTLPPIPHATVLPVVSH